MNKQTDASVPDFEVEEEFQEEDTGGFRLDEDRLFAMDRKKVIWCGIILLTVTLLSMVLFPPDTSNLVRSQEAVELLVQGLFHLDFAMAWRGLVMTLGCMLREFGAFGRAVLIVLISLGIMRLTILRRGKK